MKQDPDDPRRLSSSLAKSFSLLGSQLSQAARELKDPGIPLPETLIEELAASREEFERLCARVLERAEALSLQSILSAGGIVSLRDLETLLQVVMEAEEKGAKGEGVRQRALAVLDRVLMVVHLDDANFSPLRACQTRAQELLDTLSESHGSALPPDAEALVEGNHPFSALLAMIEYQEDLEDDHWERLQDAVAQAFGKPMAVAAARGKLMLLEESMMETATPIGEEQPITDSSAVEARSPREAPLLARGSAPRRERVRNIMATETYTDGQFIFQEGSFGEGTYVILSGEVKILKRVNDVDVVITILEKGDIFGEMSFVDRYARSASAVAVGDVQVGVVDKDLLDQEINKMPRDFRTIINALTERLRQTTTQLVNIVEEYYKFKGIN